jgi:hypothetical protein
LADTSNEQVCIDCWFGSRQGELLVRSNRRERIDRLAGGGRTGKGEFQKLFEFFVV